MARGLNLGRRPAEAPQPVSAPAPGSGPPLTGPPPTAAESMGLGGLNRRSRPDQLRYLAGKLREGESPLAVAFALDMLAGEG